MDDHCVPLSQTIDRLADWVDSVLSTLGGGRRRLQLVFYCCYCCQQLEDSLMTVCLKQLDFTKDNQSTQHTGLLCLCNFLFSSSAGYMMIGLVIFWNAPCNQKWFRVLIKSDCRIFLSIDLRSLQLNSKVNWFWNYWNTKIAKAVLTSVLESEV